jgi:sulfite reductase beta subunit-like hemoprotein
VVGVGRQLFNAVPAPELPATIERILRGYLRRRKGRETFQQFAIRHDLRALQEIFSDESALTTLS